MITPRPVTRFLASVRSVDEAVLCVAAGADVIDCKDPQTGALGALPCDVVRAIKNAVPDDILVSATVGDLVPDPQTMAAAVSAMAATGVDYVKIGIFPGGDAKATLQALAPLTRARTALVGLLLADRAPDLGLIKIMAQSGFAGVMLDTADKKSGALPDVMARAELARFIAAARQAGLFTGLAGSLRLEHIAPLLALEPDLLGFRGALCRAGDRRDDLDPGALKAVREAINRAASNDVNAGRPVQQEIGRSK